LIFIKKLVVSHIFHGKIWKI